METFSDLIERWPSVAVMAADLGQKPETVKKWKQRGAIPVDYWPDVIAAGKRRGVSLTADRLLKLNEGRAA